MLINIGQIRHSEMDDHGAATSSPATTNRCGELVAAPQSIRRGQHDCLHPHPHVGGQADRRVRPLARRVEMMARPARVRMRSRKPWVFARRRLFGW
jgi:hypothetical protein